MEAQRTLLLSRLSDVLFLGVVTIAMLRSVISTTTDPQTLEKIGAFLDTALERKNQLGQQMVTELVQTMNHEEKKLLSQSLELEHHKAEQEAQDLLHTISSLT